MNEISPFPECLVMAHVKTLGMGFRTYAAAGSLLSPFRSIPELNLIPGITHCCVLRCSPVFPMAITADCLLAILKSEIDSVLVKPVSNRDADDMVDEMEVTKA